MSAPAASWCDPAGESGTHTAGGSRHTPEVGVETPLWLAGGHARSPWREREGMKSKRECNTVTLRRGPPSQKSVSL